MCVYINNSLKNYNMYKPTNIILYVSCLILIQGLMSRYLFYKLENFTEADDNIKSNKSFDWTNKLLFDFLTIQKLINPGVVFDTNIIKNQVTLDEMQFFIKNKYFYWSKPTTHKYLHMIHHNSIIRINPMDALHKAQTIYNENAILQFLYVYRKKNQNNI